MPARDDDRRACTSVDSQSRSTLPCILAPQHYCRSFSQCVNWRAPLLWPPLSQPPARANEDKVDRLWRRRWRLARHFWPDRLMMPGSRCGVRVRSLGQCRGLSSWRPGRCADMRGARRSRNACVAYGDDLLWYKHVRSRDASMFRSIVCVHMSVPCVAAPWILCTCCCILVLGTVRRMGVPDSRKNAQ